MLDYFVNHHSRQIVGSSILFIVDNINNQHDMRIIDIASSEDFDDVSKRDEGYIIGLQSLIKILSTINK